MIDVRQQPIPLHLVALFEAVRPDGSLALEDTPSQVSCRVLPSPLSESEAKFYYAGLRSAPILVAHSSTTPWEVPTGPDTYQKLQELLAAVDKPFYSDWSDDVTSKRNALIGTVNLKRLRPSSEHPLTEVWEDNLYPKVCTLLDSMEVKWNSLDPLYIGSDDYCFLFVPAILWIGVEPGSLSGDYGAVVASECHKLIVEHGITDVDVEIREWILY